MKLLVVFIGVAVLAACAPAAPSAPPAPVYPHLPAIPPAVASTDRVLLIGDSTMNQSADDIARALPGATVVNVALDGSGIANINYDWIAALPGFLATYTPTVVVAEFIGNGGTMAEIDARSRQAISLIEATGARVVWAVPPAIYDPGNPRWDQATAVFRALPVTHCDWGAYISPGGYTTSLVWPDNSVRVVRSDTVHLAPDGEWVAGQVTASCL